MSSQLTERVIRVLKLEVTACQCWTDHDNLKLLWYWNIVLNHVQVAEMILKQKVRYDKIN